MAQLRDKAYFAEQGLVVAFAVRIGQRYLQGNPYTLNRIPGLPDLAAPAFAEVFGQPLLS
jgi:hypothetical protein